MQYWKKYNMILCFLIMVSMMINSSHLPINSIGVTDRSQGTQVVIYTYDSLFADPEFDLEGNFSLFSEIPTTDIQFIRLEDANAIVTRLIAEKDQPQADVVIGIDNVLMHLISNLSSVLEPYSPPDLNQIDDNLIQNLDPDKYLIPYDYGIISLYYHNYIINETSYPELSELTLDSLLDSDLLSMLIVENPKFSSPGLGFLLWTIAVYGDPEINFDGILKKDWRDWWRAASTSITITKSWGDAFDIFFEPAEGKPIMVSYGTSPAYGYCQWQDDSTSAILTYENGTANGWLQIEGIGLVKNAPHKQNAQKFIDWFLSSDLQSELPEHQWMYPANTEANISESFLQSAIDPNQINRLNDLIPPSMLKERLVSWQDEWERVVVKINVPGFETGIILFALVIIAIPIILRKKSI